MARPVSVVVNTYNRAASLRLTLESLTQLDYPTFEVVVVNGPSQDETESVLEEFAGRIKIGQCLNTNLSESRNIGVAMAAGEIVAFIDDDAYPDPAWLDRLVEGYDSDEVAAVGGPVYDHTGASLQARYTFGTRLGDARVGFEKVNPTEFLNSPWTQEFVNTLGTNSSFRRDRLIEIGGFDEEFEYYLDENSVCCRLVERGYVVKALDEGFVYHKFLPSDVRDANRAIRNRYQVLKSKCYFALKYGLRTNSFYDVCRSLAAYVDGSRSDYRWCVENGLLAPEDLDQFERDIHAAFDTVFERFLAGTDKTRPAEWFAAHWQPPLPFATRRRREDKLQLCFFSQGYPPGPVNGIARLIHTLAVGLAAEGHLVRVLTRGEGHDRVDLEDGVWVHRVAIGEHPAPESLDVPAHLWDYSASLLRELRRVHVHRPVDIVEAPNWDSEIIAVLLDGGFTTVVGLYTPLATVRRIDPGMVAGNPNIDRMIGLERFCYQYASALRAAEAAVVETIEDDYGVVLPADRIAFIPHGMADATAGVEPKRRDGVVNILFVGRLEKRKGIDTLLACIPDLIRAFPDVVFTIVGDDSLPGEGGVPYREAFESSEAGAAVSDRVIFTGLVSDEERQQFYAGCDIFVAPSRSESSGLILLEAMMFGKPVVAGNNHGMRSIVEDGGNGYLVAPGDPAALRQAIDCLIVSPERRAAFGTRSRQLFEERFSAARMVQETNDFFDRLLGRATTGRAEAQPAAKLELDSLSAEQPVSRPRAESGELAGRVLAPPVSGVDSGPIVLDTLGGSDELVSSHDKGATMDDEDFDRIQHAYKKLNWHVPEDVRKGGRFLDIGCGIGNGVIAALQHGAALAVGIDRSLEEFGAYRFEENCRTLSVNPGQALLLQGDIDAVVFGKPEFDFSLMLDTIEHVPEPERFIQFAYDNLRKGGYLVLDSCPLYYSMAGGHLFPWISEESDPWGHLYHEEDFQHLLKKHDISQWNIDHYEELNRVTHDQVVQAVRDCGFQITFEHRSVPTDQRRALYERYRHRIDPAKVPDVRLLYEDWILLVCKK